MPTTKDLLEQNRISSLNSAGSPEYNINTQRNSKFAISTTTFPSNLASSDLKHYVNFQINVRGKSKYNTDNRSATPVNRNPDAAGLTNEQMGQAATAGGALAGVGAALALKSLVGSFYKRVETTGGQSKVSAGTIAAAAAGAVAGGAFVNASNLFKPDQSHRITDSIALHLDSPPTVRYSMNYANKDLGTLAGIVSGSAFDTQGKLAGIGETTAAVGAAFAKLPGAFGTMDAQSAISASSKTSLNPFREVIFESVDFRSFNFKYKFMPKNNQEVEAVKRIIDVFKFHMHPEMSDGKLFFIYPSEFQITYCFGDGEKENPYFHKFAPCALENMEVTYGGEQFSSFANGAPVEVNLSLTFKELEILTKPMILEGY